MRAAAADQRRAQKVDDRITVVGTVIDFRLSNPHPIDCDPTYGIAIDSRQGPGEE